MEDDRKANIDFYQDKAGKWRWRLKGKKKSSSGQGWKDKKEMVEHFLYTVMSDWTIVDEEI